jgi:hypothetical protein
LRIGSFNASKDAIARHLNDYRRRESEGKEGKYERKREKYSLFRLSIIDIGIDSQVCSAFFLVQP